VILLPDQTDDVFGTHRGPAEFVKKIKSMCCAKGAFVPNRIFGGVAEVALL
jgi:hypothetical protein